MIPSQVHQSLLRADNALGLQSNRHPDGWGVAHYVDGCPHVTKSPTKALGDQLFHQLSAVVSSETVLAHVRKATQGDNGLLNCHPFQHGRWVFAHNGDLPDFTARVRQQLVSKIAPRLARFILGDTDSEVVFHLFLSELQRTGSQRARPALAEVIAAVRSASLLVFDCYRDKELSQSPLLTFVVTDGDSMVAVHGGKELLYSTYKTRCSDRDTCQSFRPECEAPSATGRVNHLLISSESLQGDNVWVRMSPGDIIATNGEMKLTHAHVHHRRLELAPEVAPGQGDQQA